MSVGFDFNNLTSFTIPEGQVKKIIHPTYGNIWKSISALVSTGTQVIDTGVYCTNKMSCEIKMAYTEFPSTSTYIGAIEYNNGSYYRCHFQAAILNSNQVIGFWQDSPTLGNAVSVPFDTEPHILTYSASDLTVGIDGNTATHGNTLTPSNSTFYLFDRNAVGFTANQEAGKCKLYYAKFWEDGVLVRNFVPRFDVNGKAALLDLVNNQYYYDLNGNDFSYEE